MTLAENASCRGHRFACHRPGFFIALYVKEQIRYLTVAAVLKYADAVLKGYATAISVLLTGVLSMVLFGTELSVEYALGMTNVLAAVFLYNAQDLEKHAW